MKQTRSKPAPSRQNQQGRSMVEIIAVIIIMGLLTVTGLLGFNYMIEKRKENEQVQCTN